MIETQIYRQCADKNGRNDDVITYTPTSLVRDGRGPQIWSAL